MLRPMLTSMVRPIAVSVLGFSVLVAVPAVAETATSFSGVRQVQVAAGARAIVASPDGRTVYVVSPGASNSAPGTMQAVDVASGQVTGSVAIVANPNTPVISKDGARIYIPSIEAGGVSVVDAKEMKVVGTVTFKGQTASGGNAVLSADGRYLYVPSDRNGVNMIDTKTLKVMVKAPVTTRFGSCGAIIGLAVSKDNKWMYATCGQSVLAFNPRIGNAVVLNRPQAPGTSVALYSGRAWPMLAPDGQTVVTSGSRSVEMFKVKTLKQTGQLEFPDPPDWSDLAAGVVLPSGVVVNPAASTGELLFADMSGNQVLPALKVADPLAWVPPLLAMKSSPVVIAPSGTSVYITRPGAKPSIDTVDGASGTRVARDLVDPAAALAAPVALGSPVLVGGGLAVLATSGSSSVLVLLDPK